MSESAARLFGYSLALASIGFLAIIVLGLR